jgi:hypothetical protein
MHAWLMLLLFNDIYSIDNGTFDELSSLEILWVMSKMFLLENHFL